MAVTTFRADLEHERLRRKRRRRLIFRSTLLTLIVAIVFGGFTLWRHLFTGMPTLPDTETFWTMGRTPSIELRDDKGKLLLHRGPYYGKAVDPDALPDHVVNAFLAGEDKRFYEHNGIDVSAIFRAILANWQAGYTVQGGSTLTQQLIKNTVLTPEQTLRRKAQEMYLAMELEDRLTKKEILSLYLSRIYLGQRAYGIDGAAYVYFGKTAYELDLAEASFLASLPKAPSRLSGEEDLAGAKRRQRYVLSQMVNAGFITLEDAHAAMEQELAFTDPPAPENGDDLGYIADYVTQEMHALLPNVPHDAVVTITLDENFQAIARETLDKQLKTRGKSVGAKNGAAVIIGLDGRVLAIVGGTDYKLSKFNRATQAMRQPGSSFKAFVYAAALEKGLTPESIRNDERTYITKDWAPRNYNNKYIGPVMLKDAFAHSLNTISAKLTREIGSDNVVSMAHRLGLGTDLISVPSIALGSDETTLFDMTRAYGAFARQGKRLDPFIIERIEDTRGKPHYIRKPYPDSTVLTARVARDMDLLLRRVVTNGSGWRANMDELRVAGKTGTSQNWRDAWFLGYTSNYVAGVWIGNDDNTPMKRVTGGALPAETWKLIMTKLYEAGLLLEQERMETDPQLSEHDQKRAAFYAGLSAAFSAHTPRQIAGLDPDAQTQ